MKNGDRIDYCQDLKRVPDKSTPRLGGGGSGARLLLLDTFTSRGCQRLITDRLGTCDDVVDDRIVDGL